MKNRVKQIIVHNFKSLKDIKVELSNFNVIVGKNASGKTNFIESIKFAKNVLTEEKRPYMPYIEWWSYDNIARDGKTEVPINIGFEIEGPEFKIWYEFTFSVVGGVSRIMSEKCTINDAITLEREGSFLKVLHSQELLNERGNEIVKDLNELDHEKQIKLIDLVEQNISLPSDFSNLTNLFRECTGIRLGKRSKALNYSIMDFDEKNKLVLVLPRRNDLKKKGTSEEKNGSLPLSISLFETLVETINRFTILRHPSMSNVKTPTMPRKEDVLNEDSSNLHNIMYYWFIEKGGKVPERIEKALSTLLPGVQIKPSLTSEGKAFLKMYYKGNELSPPCIPDGVYKILTILAAIELKPSLLAIDEIENSLYAEALEYIIDELRTAGTTVVVTTHSPLVVDMVKLEELLFAELTDEGTILVRLENPEAVRDQLRKQKITQSESWIYGALIN